MLARMGKILENNFQGSGSVGRTGGDEFLALVLDAMKRRKGEIGL